MSFVELGKGRVSRFIYMALMLCLHDGYAYVSIEEDLCDEIEGK